jgi:hypothetical protein
VEGSRATTSAPLTGIDKLQKELLSTFADYAQLAGPNRTALLLKVLQDIGQLEAGGQDKDSIITAPENDGEGKTGEWIDRN